MKSFVLLEFFCENATIENKIVRETTMTKFASAEFVYKKLSAFVIFRKVSIFLKLDRDKRFQNEFKLISTLMDFVQNDKISICNLSKILK